MSTLVNRVVISMLVQTFLGQPESIPFGNICSIGIAIVFNVLFYLFCYFYFMGIDVLPTSMSVYCGCLVAGEARRACQVLWNWSYSWL